MPTSTEDITNDHNIDVTDPEEFTDSSKAEIVFKKYISDEVDIEMTNGQESTDIGPAEC